MTTFVLHPCKGGRDGALLINKPTQHRLTRPLPSHGVIHREGRVGRRVVEGGGGKAVWWGWVCVGGFSGRLPAGGKSVKSGAEKSLEKTSDDVENDHTEGGGGEGGGGEDVCVREGLEGRMTMLRGGGGRGERGGDRD